MTICFLLNITRLLALRRHPGRRRRDRSRRRSRNRAPARRRRLSGEDTKVAGARASTDFARKRHGGPMSNQTRQGETPRRTDRGRISRRPSGDRRTRLLQLSAGGVFLAIIVVVVVIIVAGSAQQLGRRRLEPGPASRRSRKDCSPGSRRTKLILGKASAPVDALRVRRPAVPGLQGVLSEEVLPEIIEKQVKSGKAKHHLPQLHHHRPGIDPGRRSRARGRRTGQRLELHRDLLPQPGRGELGLRDRRIRRIDGQVRRASRTSPNSTRNARAASSKRQVEATTAQADKFGFTGTPSFAVEGPSSNGLELLGTPETRSDRRRDRKSRLTRLTARKRPASRRAFFRRAADFEGGGRRSTHGSSAPGLHNQDYRALDLSLGVQRPWASQRARTVALEVAQDCGRAVAVQRPGGSFALIRALPLRLVWA